MLLTSERRPLAGKTLALPVWLRAPLYLGEGAKCFVAMIHSNSTPEGRYQRALVELRQNLLRRVEKEIVSYETPTSSIFISFSAIGKDLGNIACDIARKNGLFPKTGFDQEVQIGTQPTESSSPDEESLPRRIMAHILSCDCFLGIWTEDFEGENKDTVEYVGNSVPSHKGYVPSVWMPFELGVAASH